MSIGGEGHIEVEDKARNFVLISNAKIYATKKDDLYADTFQICMKENKSTNKKSLKDIL